MLQVKELDKSYTIKTDDVNIIVILENAIEDKIKQLEYLIEQGIFEHNHQEYQEEIEKYEEYLKLF